MNNQTNSTVIRKNSQLYKLLSFLSSKGSVYLSDFSLFANHLCNDRGHSSRLIKQAEESGLITYDTFVINPRLKATYKITDSLRSQYKSAMAKDEASRTPAEINLIKKYKRKVSLNKHAKIKKPKSVKVVFLSENALEQLCQKDSNTYNYFLALRTKFKHNVKDNANYEKTLISYSHNHVKTLFNCVDIPTDSLTRPNLAMLDSYINSRNYIKKEIYALDAEYSNEQLESYYSKGMYFSSNEFREYIDNYLDRNETIRSAFKGLFISKDKCLVVYSNGANNEQLIYIKSDKNERELMDLIYKRKFCKSRTVESHKTGICALAISDTNMFVYSTAEGMRLGQNDSERDLSEKARQSLLVPSNELLFAKDDFEKYFHALFVVPHNKDGVPQLAYLVSNSLEDYLMEAQSITQLNDQLENNIYKENKNNIIFPLHLIVDNQKVQIMYLPVYELTSLLLVKNSNSIPLIVTKENMTKVISHITHKQHLFMDIDTRQLLDDNVSLIFNSKGYNKGKKVLEEYLHNKGKTLTVKQFNDLPKQFVNEDNKPYTYNEFYNDIGNGKIKPEEIVDTLDLIDYIPTSKKTHKVSANLDTYLYSNLKQFAKENNITLQYAVRVLLHQALDEVKE